MPRRSPAQKGSYRGAPLPSQAPSSRRRLLQKLGMGSSKQGPSARRFRIIKRTPVSPQSTSRKVLSGPCWITLHDPIIARTQPDNRAGRLIGQPSSRQNLWAVLLLSYDATFTPCNPDHCSPRSASIEGGSLQGALRDASKESGLGGSAMQLVDGELDLTPSSTAVTPQLLGNMHQHNTSSKASSASSGSQALLLTDNRFVSQPAFEERLRCAPDKHLPRTHGQVAALSSQASALVVKHGLEPAGHSIRTSKLGKTAAHPKTLSALRPPCAHHRSLTSVSGGMPATDNASSQQTRVAAQTATAAPAVYDGRGQKARAPSSNAVKPQVCEPSSAPGRLSNGRMQISPQPKPQTVRKVKAQQESREGAAEQPAKRIKYDHLLGGTALLSLAGKQKKKT